MYKVWFSLKQKLNTLRIYCLYQLDLYAFFDLTILTHSIHYHITNNIVVDDEAPLSTALSIEKKIGIIFEV